LPVDRTLLVQNADALKTVVGSNPGGSHSGSSDTAGGNAGGRRNGSSNTVAENVGGFMPGSPTA